MKTFYIISGCLGVAVIVVTAILCHPAFGRKPSKERLARIEQSPNYHEGMFHNQIPTPQFTGEKGAFRTMWKFLFSGSTERIPKSPIETVKTDLQAFDTDRDRLVWFGHSSYMFCLNGKIFLIDPVLNLEFPSSLMLRPFAGTDIYKAEDLPDIDYLILTHEHWDHLDYGTLRQLRGKTHQVICPLGVGEYMEYWGYKKEQLAELDWGEMFNDSGVCIHCLPSRHFSNRLFSSNQTLWASFMVQSGGRLVYVGGDGGYDMRFKHIYERFGEADLVIMENGQYNRDWANIHMMPDDLEKAILDLHAKQVFTVHHDKFALARHAWYEPDSVSRAIAERDSITLLDNKIGSVVYF